MSQEREELLRLVEEMPDEDVAAALADVRRRLQPISPPSSNWPPEWFGIAEGDGTAIGRRCDEVLEGGFGR